MTTTSQKILDQMWYLLMYSPDGDRERVRYWEARKEDLKKEIELVLSKTIGEVDSIDFFEIEDGVIGDKKIEMTEDFEAGAIWGWNEVKKKLKEKK
uniref:Uncharacterized protein n=1 Tax=viral metagenome TaxID=1070528 RepID=A0A6H2A5L3_9ZZZZ